MKLNIKKIFLIAITPFLISSELFADASNTPNVAISPTSQNIAAGTASVTLNVTLTPAPNKSSITVYYSDSCNNSSGTILIAEDSSNGNITIATAALLSGTTCNVTLTSAIGGTSQNNGQITASTAEIIVPSSNLPPIANAGADQTVTAGTSVTLNGGGSSDSDGSIVSYTWKDGATLLSSLASFTKSDFSIGTHTITLTVTDNSGNSNSDSLTLIVSSSVTPPVMGSIPDQSAINGTPFALNISNYVTLTNSDPITSYTLSGSLPTGLLFGSSTGAFSGTPTANGTYNFTVYATDKDGNSNSVSFTITVTASSGAPTFQNTSECGLFSSVLTSYTHIYSNGNNDQACYTNNISYPAGELTGSIECNPAGCGGGVACQRQEPPVTRLNPTFPTNSKSGSPNGSDPTTLTDLEYGNLTYNNLTINFNPATIYSDNISKVMLLGNVTISKSTLNFQPGDYYFDSLTIDSSNNNVILPNGGPVRIFIKNNFLIDMNNLSYNTAAGSSENNLFTYVGGNFESLGNGGGTTSWKAFMYVKGSTTLTNNSNNWNINGGITSEGPIEINGNNPNFVQSGDAGSLGYGACGGTTTPVLGIFDAWESTQSIANREITTKVVNKPFTLTIASLDAARAVLQTKTGITAKYQLYDYDTNSSVTAYASFDASVASDINKTYTVNPSAYKDVRVRFKYCRDANNSIKPYSNCEYPVVAGCTFKDDVASSDNFAIRPDSFLLAAPSGENINLLTSAQEYTFAVAAPQFETTTPATSYTISAANLVLSLLKTMYQPSGTLDNNLSGALSFSATPFDVTHGVANALIKFDDVGKVNIQLRDTTWANVDSDDTSGDCNATGRYVCGDINATFIPDHFTLSGVHLNNNAAQTFTYLSSDLNMSAHLDVTVSAKNLSNAVTQNFKSGSWENPVDINMSVVSAASTPTLIKDDINETQDLGFSLGAVTIAWSETNATKKLMFNFNRDINDSKNPFMINGSEVTLGAKSTYTDSGTTKVIAGSSVADQNATFIYGRTHAPRYRFATDSGTAFIYYESFCATTDSSGTTCNKALLPNGSSSLSTDDPRWFINASHTSISGAAAAVSQKNGTNIVTATAPNSANPAQTTLNYTASSTKGYPYKTTMQNSASSWLIYNKYSAAATVNEFEVEFEGSGSQWTGRHETNTTTNKSGTDKTNRRTMW